MFIERNNGVLLFTLIIILTIGCSPSYYSPTSHNVPLLDEKGELQFTGTASVNHIDFQSSYALNDYLGIQVNGNQIYYHQLFGDKFGNGREIEAGLGYFIHREVVVAEIYGIASIGKYMNRYPESIADYPGSDGTVNYNLATYGIQSNIGIKYDWFSMAFSARVFYLDYFNMEGNYITNAGNYVDNFMTASDIMIEPGFTIRAGPPNQKVQLQIVRTIPSNSEDSNTFIPLSVSLGMNLTLSEK